MHSNSMLTPVESKVLRYIARKGVLESERAIAKALRLNHSTLNYVLRKFERERVIQGYKYRLDYRQVNLKQLAWVFISLKFNTLDVDEFIAHLFKLPTARLVFVVTGDYDLAFKVYARSAEDVVQFMLGVEKDLQQWISSSSIFFVNKAFKQHGLPVADLEKPCKLSPLDVRILGARLAEPDCSLSGLAARLKVHRNTVGARWNRLLSNKVVVKKTAAINPDYYWDAGVAFHSLILMDALPGKQEELARLAADHREVLTLAFFDQLPLAEIAERMQ